MAILSKKDWLNAHETKIGAALDKVELFINRNLSTGKHSFQTKDVLNAAELDNCDFGSKDLFLAALEQHVRQAGWEFERNQWFDQRDNTSSDTILIT